MTEMNFISNLNVRPLPPDHCLRGIGLFRNHSRLRWDYFGNWFRQIETELYLDVTQWLARHFHNKYKTLRNIFLSWSFPGSWECIHPRQKHQKIYSVCRWKICTKNAEILIIMYSHNHLGKMKAVGHSFQKIVDVQWSTEVKICQSQSNRLMGPLTHRGT